MERCRRLGIDLTKLCNAKCKTCFYRHYEWFGEAWHRDVKEAMSEVIAAKNRGCNHVVFVGYGEPGLYKNLVEFIAEIKNIGMKSSMITNGTMPISRYADARNAGLDHLHVSVHGIGRVLDEVLEVNGAGAKQAELMKWLKDEQWPWRSNTTMQQANYQQLPEIVDTCIEHGDRHFVFLGFLPHYHWNEPAKCRTVAVHPKDLRPYIEAGIKKVEAANIWTTVRYHPCCHLDEKYWKYVTNARYVLLDNGEWDYGHSGDTDEQLVSACKSLGDSVANTDQTCQSCSLFEHCGGWNRYYTGAFDGADRVSVSDAQKGFGVYFWQNHFNTEFKGHFE